MTTRRAPRIWKATSIPAVPPSTSRTSTGTPPSHRCRIRIGPTPSSPRSRLPQPTTSRAHGTPPSRAPSTCGAALVIRLPSAGSDRAVDDELAELATLAVVGVHGAHKARVEAASDVTELDRVVLVDDGR